MRSRYHSVLCAFLGHVLLGLFRNRNTRNRRYLCSFGGYSVFGMKGISFRSFCSKMNRMEGIRFTRNIQNTRSFGKFLAGNPCSATDTQVRTQTGSSGHLRYGYSVSRSRSVLFEIEIPCILLFLNRNKNSQNSPKIVPAINPRYTRGCRIGKINK